MAKRRMRKKSLDLGEHKLRLAAAGGPKGKGLPWTLALLALAAALLALVLLKP
jgi:hypothetical protein